MVAVVDVVSFLLCLHGSLVAVVACWWVSLISAEEKKTDFVEEVHRGKYQFRCREFLGVSPRGQEGWRAGHGMALEVPGQMWCMSRGRGRGVAVVRK
jgi:hypothetical protein